MSFLTFRLLLVAYLIFSITASPLKYFDISESRQPILANKYESRGGFALIRAIRSPGKANIDLGIKHDESGHEAGIKYKQNLYTSEDGSFSIGAFAEASHNFYSDRTFFNGGIRLTI